MESVWFYLSPRASRQRHLAVLDRKRSKLLHEKEARKNISLDYDPTNCKALKRFETCKNSSPCLFAKTARLWGSPEYRRELSLEENCELMIPALLVFFSRVEDAGQDWDGFLIEVRGLQHCNDVLAFSGTVRTVLNSIGENDPSGLNCAKMASISSPSWYYSFCNVPIFVTTFAPFYDSSSSRHMGELTAENSDSCFILLQPEISFLRHKIGADTPHTNWSNPVTIRDKIRVNFRAKNKSYYIPSSTSYAVSEHIVHSVGNVFSDRLQTNPVRFWE